jgi:hypothetical protein
VTPSQVVLCARDAAIAWAVVGTRLQVQHRSAAGRACGIPVGVDVAPCVLRAPMRPRDHEIAPGAGAGFGLRHGVVGIGDVLDGPPASLEAAIAAATARPRRSPGPSPAAAATSSGSATPGVEFRALCALKSTTVVELTTVAVDKSTTRRRPGDRATSTRSAVVHRRAAL